MRNWLKAKEGRVVVVHCKAGKGRSGTASCSYLISEEGWSVKDALKRFTERRMRPNWGPGVSIPSQLRWIGYVDRWKHNKLYVERRIEILEVHCWSLRDGVKIEIEGFANDGKIIRSYHTFTKSEREIVRGEIQQTEGLSQLVSEVMDKNGMKRTSSKRGKQALPKVAPDKAEARDEDASPVSKTLDGAGSSKPKKEEKVGDVVYRPSKRVIVPTSDVNIDIERRNKAAFNLTMVTSVAHVWFNAYFEGNGPEKNGEPDESGVFSIEWDAMDGIKGSSRKGTQAFDKIAVLWKAVPTETGQPGILITEPGEGEEVQQPSPADWKGQDHVAPSEGKDLGLRSSSPNDCSADISRANSVKSQTLVTAPGTAPDENGLEGVRSHIPTGGETEAPNSGAGRLGPFPMQTDQERGQSDGPAHAKRQDAASGAVGGTENASAPEAPQEEAEEEEEGEASKTVSEHSLGHLGKKKQPSY